MTLNCIWDDGVLYSGDLGTVEYSFIAITPRSTLIQSGITCYVKFFFYSWAFNKIMNQKPLKNQLHK